MLILFRVLVLFFTTLVIVQLIITCKREVIQLVIPVQEAILPKVLS